MEIIYEDTPDIYVCPRSFFACSCIYYYEELLEMVDLYSLKGERLKAE